MLQILRCYLTKEGHIRKFFCCLIQIEEHCVRKSEGSIHSKFLGFCKLVPGDFVTKTKQSNVSVNSNWVHPPPGNPRGLAQKHCPGGRDLTCENCPGAGNSTRAGILWKFKVKHFVRVLVLSVINTGCPGQGVPKIAKQWGTLHC